MTRGLWKGKPVEELSSAELIDALFEMAELRKDQDREALRRLDLIYTSKPPSYWSRWCRRWLKWRFG